MIRCGIVSIVPANTEKRVRKVVVYDRSRIREA